jgi:hypothetical protein
MSDVEDERGQEKPPPADDVASKDDSQDEDESLRVEIVGLKPGETPFASSSLSAVIAAMNAAAGKPPSLFKQFTGTQSLASKLAGRSSPFWNMPEMKPLEFPHIDPANLPQNVQIKLQRGILQEQEMQNKALLVLVEEATHSSRQTTWTLRFTAFSAVVAIIALGLAVYFGTRPTTSGTSAPLPSPSLSRSATP